MISAKVEMKQSRSRDQSGRTKIHLTPFDLSLLQIDCPQRGLLFPKPDQDFKLISRLKSSLSTALEIYFPFAGRLAKVENLEDNTVSFHTDCDGSGARFLHAEAKSLSVSDIVQPHGEVPDFIKHFFPADGLKNSDGLTEPLLAVQVTEMKDGVFLGYYYNHMVADGVSVWNFLHTWSMICSSGSSSGHQPLVLKRWFLQGVNYPIHIPVSEAERPPPQPSRELSSVPVMQDRVFHFTKKNISDLKAKANSEVGSSDTNISSLQAVSAHMWRSIIRHSALTGEGETHCKVVVDLRQRVNPPLENDCFGNMVYITPATTTVEELLGRGLKGVGSRMAGDTVLVSSSPRFDVYRNDFGWGKPVAVRAGPGNSISGKLVLFPGIDEGSFDIQTTLWCDVLVNLLADVEFLEHVTTMV
ncbi:hypothetical protein Bca52824_076956 [Brassica carinata]|uniref:Acetyltransferase n=1 Tax=Brassica carinata TaxID=52824 RepID=A0A8X7PUU5_BRACI|nr:hypothetical protein Bca52824_076956 [Brassica carinata]